jgi:BON domain
LLQALAADPVTAPYHFSTEWVGGRVVLRGRVGTKQVHDEAVQIAIASGVPFTDSLIIDTAEAHRAAVQGAYPISPILTGPAYGGYGPLAPPSYSYVYPPPLFGRYDDPFFGLEPPLLSYPPWWGPLSAHRLSEYGTDSSPDPVAGAMPTPSSGPLSPSGLPGSVEMTIDPLGVATLRGSVATEADRIAVGQRLAQVPGVTEVINLLDVRGDRVPAPSSTPVPAGVRGDDVPPPPPTPVPAGEARPAEGAQSPALPPRPEDDNNAAPADDLGLNHRLEQALARRPDLADAGVRVTARGGVVTLSGRVPTVYEAMLAYRAVQQTPGVHTIIDRLEFEVPDGQRRNPLLQKGRPEDVEPYLEAQVRRQVGDQAHIDRVRLHGDTVEIRGTLDRSEDRPRIEAILRSIPVLRGFRLDPQFLAE